MNRRSFGLSIFAADPNSIPTPTPTPKPGPSGPGRLRPAPTFTDYLRDPRSAVLVFLGAALLIGGGRKLLQGRKAKRAIEALDQPHPSVEAVEDAAGYGRDALIDLFRLLGTAETPDVRDAAGRGIARLWARDDLIAEEEKALVRRGYVVTWTARRKYPRGVKTPIAVLARFGVPFLVEGANGDGDGVKPSNLEWSYRIIGAERAGLETFSPWLAGTGLASFRVDPSDFLGNGPFRLSLQARVRTVGLTEKWEFELPHMPMTFEFDPNLSIDALLTLPDEARAQTFARACRLETLETPLEGGSTYLDLNPDLVLKDPPRLRVTTPLPCDLAHRLNVEIEGIPGQFRAGSVIVGGQGSGDQDSPLFPLSSIVGLPPEAIERPGEIRLRAVLTADPDLGWAEPEVRSIWPGSLTTDWVTARVIRK